MQEFLNTLYVTTEPSYLHLDHDTIRMEVGGQTQFRMPLLHLGSIVLFGNVLVSPGLLSRCAEDGRSVTLLDSHGRFKARIEGPVSGNVLLRLAQYSAANTPARALAIARNIIAGKLQNNRQILLRGAREARAEAERARLEEAGEALADGLRRLERCDDLDVARGIEGEAARAYFQVFEWLVREDRDAFRPHGRTRRPPLDRMNALLSFVYTLLLHDCVSAAEGVGLDPRIGFLHVPRPGRPALGLDLMEEFRGAIADRLVLALINRRQIQREDFVEREGGSVTLTEKGRKSVLVAYQRRKQDEVQHRILGKRAPLGLIPHIQARVLARHLRGDLADYPPFVYR